MKRSRLLGAVYASVALMVLSKSAAAALIYTETFIPNTATASDVDFQNESANVAFLSYAANDFIPVTGGTITDISWKGFYFSDGTPQASDDFTINFYSDTGGTAGGLLASFNVGDAVNRTGTGQFHSGSEFFSYQADIGAGIDVLSGSTYWVSIFNDTTVDTNDDWYWATNTGMSGPGYARNASTDGISWEVTSSDLPYYFELSSAVPIPPALWLFGSGLLGLVGMARYKKS